MSGLGGSGAMGMQLGNLGMNQMRYAESPDCKAQTKLN